ncbi:PREDICTED: uncharacterized protein LOC109116903 [Tarenaya hassleriana]|uniref:uncharacterized protein LOC109116903 n=1 Tax=Tarenaya hassleriana TaxID=28532 RepID=UPI0008FCF160|nr:PREDICTED: uncharacterized protein LOC109116903 [Tarenaya hassleriana]
MMSLVSDFFCCFAPKPVSRVASDEDDTPKISSFEKRKGKPKSSRAPVVVTYFPVGSNLSRL